MNSNTETTLQVTTDINRAKNEVALKSEKLEKWRFLSAPLRTPEDSLRVGKFREEKRTAITWNLINRN